MTGGSVKTLDLCDTLGESLGSEVVTWNPTAFLKTDPSVDTELFNSIQNQLGVAIGLALR